jgi:cyclic pyranopterin phosphate synthase
MELPASSWGALGNLERYVLHKIALKGNVERLRLAHEEIIGHSQVSSHVAPQGGVRMVDVGSKAASRRSARAGATVTMSPGALARLVAHDVPKGNVLDTARIAGIMAAKKTSELIPLCHPLALTRAEVDFEFDEAHCRVVITANVETVERTGVEMEALTAASVAALTIYDMMKSLDRAMVIGAVRLLEKTGGRSGDFHAEDSRVGEGTGAGA